VLFGRAKLRPGIDPAEQGRPITAMIETA